MYCKYDHTELEPYENGNEIFGPGTSLLVCPTCHKSTLCALPHVFRTVDPEARRLTPSERKLVMHGIERQLYRASLGPQPKQYCACPNQGCRKIFRVEKKPCTALGTDYMDGDDLVVYISTKAGQEVCTCFHCKSRFPIVKEMLIHDE